MRTQSSFVTIHLTSRMYKSFEFSFEQAKNKKTLFRRSTIPAEIITRIMTKQPHSNPNQKLFTKPKNIKNIYAFLVWSNRAQPMKIMKKSTTSAASLRWHIVKNGKLPTEMRRIWTTTKRKPEGWTAFSIPTNYY